MTDEQSPLSIIRHFLEAWERRDFHAIMSHLSPQIVYQNVPRHLMRGLTESAAFIRPIIEETSKIELRLDAIALAADGRTVLTERMDYLHYPGGVVTLPIMGIFEMDGDLIAAWRDYTDGGTAAAQFAAAGVTLVLAEGV